MVPNDEAGRIAAAELALRDAGIEARVEVAGHNGEIAVVHAVEHDPLRLTGLAPVVKAAGFRYVTIDLAAPVRLTPGDG